MRRSTLGLAALTATLAVAGIAHAGGGSAGFEVTYETETPGQLNATLTTGSTFSVYGVENFDSLPTGTYANGTGFTTDYGLSTPTDEYTITGTYASLQDGGIQINPADQYGGAGGTGNYIVALQKNPGYSLTLTTSNPKGIDYFGYWLSALDAGNQISFYDATGDLLFSFTPQDVLSAVNGNSAYYGNPNAAFSGQNSSQPYVFLNFYATGGVHFSKVVFSEDPTNDGGYESDNHTVGDWLTMSGTSVGNFSVPEPASWALMTLGFGALGASLRRRRSVASAA
jgi:hypothetical protein